MARSNLVVPHDGFRIRTRGRLPHWEQDNSLYFVTFRLKDSLPRHVVRELMEERKRLKERSYAVGHAFNIRYDRELDSAYGSCLLKHPTNAEIVANALEHFDGLRYELHAWCVMPNHVHVVFELQEGANLDRVLHSWKSFTAHQIGAGVIWQREYFDRLIRDEAEYLETCDYVETNPETAGLMAWSFSSAAGRRRASRRDAGAPL